MKMSVEKLGALCALALAVGATPQPAIGQGQSIYDGNGFFSDCAKTDKADFTSGYCLGFVMGLSTVSTPTLAKTLEEFRAKRGHAYCEPSKLTNGQVFEIVLDYVRRTPRYRHLRMTDLYTLSMNEAYPCEQGSTIKVYPELGVIALQAPAP